MYGFFGKFFGPDEFQREMVKLSVILFIGLLKSLFIAFYDTIHQAGIFA